MLTKRLLTGTGLAVATILAVLFLPVFWFFVLSGVFFLFLAWEFNTLLGIKDFFIRCAVIFSVVLVGFIICFYDRYVFTTVLIASLWWLLAAFLVYKYPKFNLFYNLQSVKFLITIFALAPAFLALNYIVGLSNGRLIILYVFAIVWSMDIGAYFAGTYFGKRKLLEQVSPKKTYEGLFGGLIASLAVGLLLFFIFSNNYRIFIYVVAVVLLTAFFAQVGDLFESMLKRQNNIKDVGQYLPGHGGMLDRVDSLLAALPIFLFLSLLL